MDSRELKEYHDDEFEQARRLYERLEGQPKVSIKSFYPELDFSYLHCNDGCADYKMWGPRLERPLPLLLPFHESVVVEIDPLRNESAFRKLYGLSVDRLLRLARPRGDRPPKIQFRLGNWPFRYAELDDDYLDPILERRPPSRHRSDAFTRFCLRNNAERLSNEAADFFAPLARNPPINKKWTHYFANLAAHYHSTRVTWFQRLAAVGYEDLARDLAHQLETNMKEAADLFWTYYKTLAGSRYHALDGVNICVETPNVRSPGQLDLSRGHFPVDVAKLLISELDLLDFRTVGEDELIEISREVENARVALAGLDAEVSRLSDKIPDRSQALREAWGEANDTINSILDERARTAQSVPIVFGAIGAAVGSIFGPAGSVAGSVIGGAAGVRLAEPVATTSARFLRERHIVAILDLKDASLRRGREVF